MSLGKKTLYEFGDFLLDPAQHQLLRHGQSVPLTPKAFDLLLVLVQSGGRLLTKDDLMKKVWPDSFVEEANLTVSISSVRKALGDSLNGMNMIETVPKVGYRFVAPVKELSDEAEDRHLGGVSGGIIGREDATPAARLPAHGALPRIALILVVLALASGIFLHFSGRAPKLQTLKAAPPHRLAILPFRNLQKSSDDDFLGYSLADAVITKLGYFRSLRVRPSYAVAKYRGPDVDIAQVARDLNVDTVLTGNFIRDGQNLRITCQLVDIGSQSILWNGTINLKYRNLLTVHDDLAQEVIKGLELHLSPTEEVRLKPDANVDARAYEYYLRGVDLYSKSEFAMATGMFEKSVELDPNYALAWAYLGRSHNAKASFQFGGRDDYARAQSAFDKALSLQPQQIEARIYIANFFTDTGRVEQAVPLLREALKTNPDHAEAHWELGYAYRFAGMLDESVAECEVARKIDPGVKIHSSALNAYLYLGQYDKFLAALPQSDNLAFVQFYRGFGEYYSDHRDEATRHFDRAYELDRELMQAQVGKALSYSIAKQNARGLEILGTAEQKIRGRGVGDSEAIYKIAQAYDVLGDSASALRMLRLSVENGFFAYPYFTRDPLLDSLRHSPEFDAVMQEARTRHEAFQKAFF
jgi:DNA-binding winged helix-turn-helix (wHTH) protein/TolB-like protein/Flp pilus assembly protein TadD